MLLSIDEGLGQIMESLETKGILDETVIVFTSDNGYFFGEHGFSIERRMPYDESIRSPILIRYGATQPHRGSHPGRRRGRASGGAGSAFAGGAGASSPW